MRSPEEIQQLIIDYAVQDHRVRAVLLNGSRANTNVVPDKYQDFDIVYIVTDLDSFVSDHRWTKVFGNQLLSQMPDEMIFGNEGKTEGRSFGYLMIFQDGNRIDLTLFDAGKFATDFVKDSLTVVWLDKDNLFPGIEPPSDTDYLIKKPSEKEFTDTCNEFWWVSTYVSKGLLRNQTVYAKEMLETVVRKMFLNVIEWYIGTETNFTVSAGNHGKFMENYLSAALYEKILLTYPDHQIKNIWASLFLMTDLFGQLASLIAERLHYHYHAEEEANAKWHLNRQREFENLKMSAS